MSFLSSFCDLLILHNPSIKVIHIEFYKFYILQSVKAMKVSGYPLKSTSAHTTAALFGAAIEDSASEINVQSKLLLHTRQFAECTESGKKALRQFSYVKQQLILNVKNKKYEYKNSYAFKIYI